MADGLTRDVFGRHFNNPVLLAAGTAGFGHEIVGVMDLTRLGGVVTKSISLQPRSGNPPPRVAEFRGGMLNSVGLANPGVAAAARDGDTEALGFDPGECFHELGAVAKEAKASLRSTAR